MNPIETLWALVEREVGREFPVNTEELLAACDKVFKRWAKKRQPTINALVKSFTKRCRTVVEREGGFCK